MIKTAAEFNNKYKDYLGEGHYGMSWDDEKVLEFLDTIFEDFIKIPDFKYQQIKLKFGKARFYSSLSQPLCFLIENKINEIIKK